MKQLKCCVIDDEALAGELIASYVERTPTLKLAGVYTSASEAIKVILDGEIDLVFLDIEMPQINGLEFAKILPPECKVVFTTAYDRYAVQGFRVNAVDYLLKPVSYQEFLEAVSRVQKKSDVSDAEHGSRQKREFLIVKSEYRQIQVRISDIEFIEGLKDYIKIYISSQPKPILTLISMKSIEQVLPEDSFMRVHRSYIINKSKISLIERNHIIISGHVIPVSDSYRQQFADYVALLNPDSTNG